MPIAGTVIMSFWPFSAKCPVDGEAQAWIDQRMQWLAAQFGMQTWRMARAVEPTDEFFPDPYDKSERALQNMLERVCAFMGVQHRGITLRIFSEARPQKFACEHESKFKGAAGRYVNGDEQIVAIESSSLAEPVAVVATLAHELAHVRLLGEGRMSKEETDLEPLTDLATVFFGLGIFTANSRFRFSQWSDGRMQGWKAKRLGYLNEQMVGYALGLWACGRNEVAPEWTRHLVTNPRSYMKQTLRFLRKYPPATLKP